MDGEKEQGGGAPGFPKEKSESQRRLWGINRIFNPEMQSLSRFSDEELQDPSVQLRLLLETIMGTSAIELKLLSLAVILVFFFSGSLTGIPLIIFGIFLIVAVLGIIGVTIAAVFLVIAGLFQSLFLEGSREDRYRDVLEGKTREELRDICREQGLSESGNKQKLVSRVSENTVSVWGTFMYLSLSGLGVLAYVVLDFLFFLL
jgi:hypothetical protein|tara:strand:- start:99 stop:707 length:609 start_codon:yes stop_codon:yes gene_type:complete